MKSSAKDRKLITELVINTKQYRRSLRE